MATEGPDGMLIAWHGSPNFYTGRGGANVSAIIMHETDGATAESAVGWFADPASQVSAHYVIDRDGSVYQCVALVNAAWHCPSWNRRSVGIECVAVDGERLAVDQAGALSKLVQWLKDKLSVPIGMISGHRFMVDTPKACPGALFGDRTLAALQQWVKDNVK